MIFCASVPHKTTILALPKFFSNNDLCTLSIMCFVLRCNFCNRWNDLRWWAKYHNSVHFYVKIIVTPLFRFPLSFCWKFIINHHKRQKIDKFQTEFLYPTACMLNVEVVCQRTNNSLHMCATWESLIWSAFFGHFQK